MAEEEVGAIFPFLGKKSAPALATHLLTRVHLGARVDLCKRVKMFFSSSSKLS
jgi:hypothetical protein